MVNVAVLVPELPSAIVTSVIEMSPTTGVLVAPEIAKLPAGTTAPVCSLASAMPVAAPEPSGSHITAAGGGLYPKWAGAGAVALPPVIAGHPGAGRARTPR